MITQLAYESEHARWSTLPGHVDNSHCHRCERHPIPLIFMYNQVTHDFTRMNVKWETQKNAILQCYECWPDWDKMSPKMFPVPLHASWVEFLQLIIHKL